jgi:hypothetical protein
MGGNRLGVVKNAQPLSVSSNPTATAVVPNECVWSPRGAGSNTSHDCGFVAFEASWCWEHPDLLLDDVRYVEGPKRKQRSVSLIPVYEGLEFDLVVSRTSSGHHKMRSACCFRVVSGKLELVSNRTPKKMAGPRH